MKHLETAGTFIVLTIIIHFTTGCSESTSRARGDRSPAPSAAAAAPRAEAVEVEATPQPIVVAESTPAIDVRPAAAALISEAAEEEEAPTPAALELMRLEMARGVERYEPVGAADSFVHDGTPLFAFMQVANRSVEDHEVVIQYEHSSGQHVGPVRLTIPAGSRGWRTFTRTAWVRHPGTWTVTVRSADGALLGQREFTIES